MKHNELQYKFSSSFVYAKCKDLFTRPFWDKMLYQATCNTKPWCAIGDFNVITAIEEQLGGVPYHMRKSMDVLTVIEGCGLLDICFSGHKFTWSNKWWKNASKHYNLLVRYSVRSFSSSYWYGFLIYWAYQVFYISQLFGWQPLLHGNSENLFG